MPENWKTYKLSELASVITKGTTPSTYGFDFEKSGITYIRAQSLNYDGIINEEAFSYISEEAHHKLKRSQLEAGDILYSMAGAYLGMVGTVKASYCPANTNQAVGIIRINNPSVSTEFVEYALRNPSMISYVNSQSGQSAQPNINLAEIGNLTILVPPLQEQKAIASILSALDDKIELNLQMNKTLEEMAMALYKHWFVDFGPFQNGNFVESELGMIPEGWEVKRLPQISKNYNSKRKPISTREREKIKGNYPYYGATKILNYVDHFNFDGEYILLAEDGTVKTENDTPFLQFIEGKFCVSNHAHVLRGDKNCSNEFLFLCLSNENVIPIITGAVQLKINKQNLESLQFITSPIDILKSFDELVIPLFAQKRSIFKENQTLTTLRDTLLTKLISGEVRVKDIEQHLVAL